MLGRVGRLKPTQPRTFRLPDDLWYWLTKHAAEQDSSVAYVIRVALTEYRAKIEQPRRRPDVANRERGQHSAQLAATGLTSYGPTWPPPPTRQSARCGPDRDSAQGATVVRSSDRTRLRRFSKGSASNLLCNSPVCTAATTFSIAWTRLSPSWRS